MLKYFNGAVTLEQALEAPAVLLNAMSEVIKDEVDRQHNAARKQEATDIIRRMKG